jgi:hypothetical protein
MVLDGGTRQAKVTGITVRVHHLIPLQSIPMIFIVQMGLFACGLASLLRSVEAVDEVVIQSSISWQAQHIFLYCAIMGHLCGAFNSLCVMKMLSDLPIARFQRQSRGIAPPAIPPGVDPQSRLGILYGAGMAYSFSTLERMSYWVQVSAWVSTFITLALWVALVIQSDDNTWSWAMMGFVGPCATVVLLAFGSAASTMMGVV